MANYGLLIKSQRRDSMKRYCLIGLFSLVLAGPILAQNNNSSAQQQIQGNEKAQGHKRLYCDPVNMSFAQIITSGELKQVNANKNIYRLTISNPSPYILYYAKRPKRLSGMVPLSNFIKAWNVGANSLAKNPPNGILYPGMINQNANKSGDAFRLIVSNPKYNNEANKMTYLVKPLTKSGLLMNDMNLNYSVLFIH